MVKFKLIKTIGATFVCLLIVYVLLNIIGVIFKNMSISETWILICFSIVILLAIFFCTFTVLDAIKKYIKDDNIDET